MARAGMISRTIAMGKAVTVRPVSSSIASRTPTTSVPARWMRVEVASLRDAEVVLRKNDI